MGLRREAATRAAFHFGQCVYLGGHFGLAPLIAQLGGEESVYLLPLGAADAGRLWLVSPVEDRLSKQGQPTHAVGYSLLGQSDALSVDRYVGVRCLARRLDANSGGVGGDDVGRRGGVLVGFGVGE